MNGFERLDQPGKRVIIIGAGMAGLVAGYELARGTWIGACRGRCYAASMAVRHGEPRRSTTVRRSATPLGVPIA